MTIYILDPKLALSYVQQIRETVSNVGASSKTAPMNNTQEDQGAASVQPSCSSENFMSEVGSVTLWKSSKNPTERDHSATLIFLGLRKELDTLFNDKKSCKNQLWTQIAGKMNSMGFFVGNGVEGRDKCRQKFANLQSSYIKFMDRRKTTGEGKLKKPPYFEEINEILGDKDKTEPVLIIDSLKNDSGNKENETQGKKGSKNITETIVSNTNSESSDSCSSNRFTNVKSSAKPNKNEIMEKLYDNMRLSEENRAKEFKEMLQFLNHQSEQRHQQLMGLISSLKKRKRKRSSDSDSS